MATATMKFNITTQQPTGFGSVDQETVTYSGTVSFSAAGDTYATGGLLPFAGFALANLGPYADRIPIAVYVESRAGSGWTYTWANAAGKLKILASAAGSGTTAQGELTNATALNVASPNIFTDDVIFQAIFPRK